MVENLVIVESPAKAKTIEKFLGKNFVVKSSFGHIRDLKKRDLSVDIENNYQPHYTIPADKKKIVTELKKMAADAKTVWLASDEDREGEAIAWHLSEALKLDDDKTRRIVFHEITKDAILNAIESPRKIDQHLVNAQQARRVLDRIVGFEISPILWRKVKPSLSAGRVQSVAVKLIVEREREILAFKPESSFRVIAEFLVPNGNGDTLLKAELSKRFKTAEETAEFLEGCKDATFTINDINKKPAKKSPAPPFTTSTLQQEASRKLGYSVAQTMSIAQRLYEAGNITYMRTDSFNLSSLAINTSKSEITEQFGSEYSKVRQYATKSKGAQEAHEAIRPTYVNQHEIKGSAQEQRLYELIWKRTVASQMSDAQLERTTIKIGVSNQSEHFTATGEIIKFDGFLKLYIESQDDDDTSAEESGILPEVKLSQMLDMQQIVATERFSLKPPRYTEASLVRKLEELGIGRPSTYAPTISTIQNREYVVKESREGESRNYKELVLKDKAVKEANKTEKYGYEKGKLFPTDIGMVVNDFLDENFTDIMNYNFTAEVEKEFDVIAEGKLDWTRAIDEFYKDFHPTVEKSKEHSDKKVGERILGDDPKTGRQVSVKIGRFGPMVQIGTAEEEEKPQFASLLKGQSINTITLEEALDLFKLPREVGEFEDSKVVIGVGRFGPYVRHSGKFVSLGKEDDPLSINLDRAVELIKAKREQDKNSLIKTFDEEPDLQILKGRYGPYIKYKKKNFKIPKGTDPESMTLEKCRELTKDSGSKGKKKARKSAKKTTTKPSTKASKK